MQDQDYQHRQFARTSHGSNQNQQHRTLRDLNSSAQTQHGPNPASPKSKLAKGSPGLSTTRDQTQE